jgi:hypothetical protein
MKMKYIEDNPKNMRFIGSSAIACLFNRFLRGTIKILMYKNLPYPAASTPHNVVADVVVPVKYFAIYAEAGVLKTLSLACSAKLNRLR